MCQWDISGVRGTAFEILEKRRWPFSGFTQIFQTIWKNRQKSLWFCWCEIKEVLQHTPFSPRKTVVSINRKLDYENEFKYFYSSQQKATFVTHTKFCLLRSNAVYLRFGFSWNQQKQRQQFLIWRVSVSCSFCHDELQKCFFSEFSHAVFSFDNLKFRKRRFAFFVRHKRWGNAQRLFPSSVKKFLSCNYTSFCMPIDHFSDL